MLRLDSDRGTTVATDTRDPQFEYKHGKFFGDGILRDHCILGQTFSTLSPHFWIFCQERVFFCIILMIQLWRFSEIACSISIKNIFVIVIKVPKMRGWGNEDSFSKFPVLYGLLERPKRKRCRETVYKKFYSVEPLNAAARFCSSLAEKNWILFSEVSHNFTWPLVLAALIVSFCYFFLSF